MKSPQKLLALSPPCLLLLLCLTPACKQAGRAFGPKDEGGSYLILSVTAEGAQLEQAISQTIEVMQKRCDQLGVNCKTERAGGDKPDQFKLKIPAVTNPERIKSVLLSEGLEIRAVVSPPNPAPVQTYSTREEAVAAAGTNHDVLPYLEREEPTAPGEAEDGQPPERFIVVEREPIVTGRQVSSAEAVNWAGGETAYQVNFMLNREGAERLGSWTAANISSYLAVVLNREARSVAYVKSQITDSGQISGRFTKQQAEDMALILRSGSLPAPVRILEEGTYKP
jgi:preprotein translocase subunit SecD